MLAPYQSQEELYCQFEYGARTNKGQLCMLFCLQHISKLLKHGLFNGISKSNHKEELSVQTQVLSKLHVQLFA